MRLALDQMAEGAMAFDWQPTVGDGDRRSGDVTRIIWVNQGLLSLTGMARAELEGQSLSQLLEGAVLADFLQRLGVVSETRRRYHVDVPMKFADGRQSRLRWFLRAQAAEPGQAVRHVVAIRPMPQELKDHEALAEHIGRLENFAQLTSGVAHDFNNVLAVLQTRLSLALESSDKRARRELLEDAKASCEAAAALVRRLIMQSSGNPGDRLEWIHPIKAAEEAIRIAASGPDQVCSLEICPLPDMVRADPLQIQQILSNLLVNARQSMGVGGKIEVEVNRRTLSDGEIAYLPAGRYMEWIVRDHGCGISPEVLPHVFEAYFTTKKDGTGLGLSTSMRLARANGGILIARSENGVGSEFSLLLPSVAHRPPVQPLAPPPPRHATHGALTQRITGPILVADDNSSVRDALCRQLDHLGYHVLAAATAEEAVSKFRTQWAAGPAPAAVLMDLDFNDGSDGVSAARQILAIEPRAVLIACSGNIGLPHASESLPFSAILTKPFGLHELADVLAGATGRVRDDAALALI